MEPLKMAGYFHLKGRVYYLIPLLEVVFLALCKALNADHETLSFHRIKKTLSLR